MGSLLAEASFQGNRWVVIFCVVLKVVLALASAVVV